MRVASKRKNYSALRNTSQGTTPLPCTSELRNSPPGEWSAQRQYRNTEASTATLNNNVDVFIVNHSMHTYIKNRSSHLGERKTNKSRPLTPGHKAMGEAQTFHSAKIKTFSLPHTHYPVFLTFGHPFIEYALDNLIYAVHKQGYEA